MSKSIKIQKVWLDLNWLLAIIIGVSLGVSYTIHFLKISPFNALAYIGFGLGCGLAYFVLTHFIRPAWRESSSGFRWGSLGLVGLIIIAVLVLWQQSPTIYWQWDTDPHTWQPARLSTGTTWGQSFSLLKLHATSASDGANFSPDKPWRVVGDLADVLPGVAKQLTFQVTQPLQDLIDQQTQQIAAPGSSDGVTLVFKVERAAEWLEAQRLRLDLINQPEQQRWHTIEVVVPADGQRVAIEVLPGSTGSDVVFDSVWVSQAQVRRTGSQLVPLISSLPDLISLSFFGLSGLVLASSLIRKLNQSGFFTPEEISPGVHLIEPIKQRFSGRACLISGLIITPSLVWIWLDRSPFYGDASQYARASVQLFYILLRTPSSWGTYLLEVFPPKPNGLIWFGQFFVPLGYLIGSIDRGLLLAVLVIQTLVLILMYQAIWELAQGKLWVSLIGCLVIASAPLFVALVGHYMVESIQTLAVAWFILIMSLAPKWDRAFLLSQLCLATIFALLTKQTTPLFCLWPGLIALGYVIWPRPNQNSGGWLQKRTLVTLFLSVPLGLATIAWYYHNLEYVIWHIFEGSTGPIVTAMWGKSDTFLNTLYFWLGVTQRSFFLPVVLGLSGCIFVSGLIYYLVKPDRPMKYFLICNIVTILQIITVLGVFSLSSTRVDRYILPLLPYLAVLICWGIAQANKPILIALSFAIFMVQLITVNGQALGLLAPNPDLSAELRPIDSQGQRSALLDAIVARTCADTDSPGYLNILAIDPALKGDWLAPEPANYVAIRNIFPDNNLPACYYDYAGDNFFGSSAADAWDSIVLRRVRYFITVDPQVYPIPPKVFNQTLNEYNFPLILTKVQTSGLFEPQASLTEDPGILIFKRIDYVQRGQMLLEQGQAEQALNILQKATALEPNYPEAWFNLAMAYVHLNQMDKAIATIQQVLSLNPNHFGANLALAEIYYNRGELDKAISLAQRALTNAPNPQERLKLLVYIASGYAGIGQIDQACKLINQAIAIESNEDLLRKQTQLNCPQTQAKD